MVGALTMLYSFNVEGRRDAGGRLDWRGPMEDRRCQRYRGMRDPGRAHDDAPSAPSTRPNAEHVARS